MMKKTNLQLWFFATLLCGLSLGVTSCKDDDNEPSEEEKAKQAEEQAIAEQEKEMTAFNVLDYLADMSEAPADYLTGSYEPSIGVADGSDASTRIVSTNDMETAALRFADMVSADINEETQTYTWTDDKVGTLTYTKTDDGQSWATVDVSIKQIPHLQKIIFRSPQQADNNGEFDGTAFYRFGDIVRKKNADGNFEYWFCVRPCFGPEGKEKSHWVTISPLPKNSNNVYTYHSKTNGIDYALPTKIGDNYEQAKNFAEMLYAICYPDEWQQNIINNPYKSIGNKGITMFHDFNKSNLMYHSNYFWKRVQDVWKKRGYFKKFFGYDFEEFQKMLTSEDGLNLLTNGYSWPSGNSPKLYRYRFTNGTGKESNMHKEPIKHDFLCSYHSVKAEVISANTKLNVNDDYTADNPGWSVPKFFGTKNKHYIIRHATGAELASTKKEDAKMELKEVNVVEPVYIYNVCYGISSDDAPETFDAKGNPSKELDLEYKDRAYYMFGDIVQDENGKLWVCVQSSGQGLTDDQPYSYFVSFDAKNVGSKFEYLPETKELAAQILFNIEIFHHNYQLQYYSPLSTLYCQEKNIRENLGVKLSELVGVRDTMYAYTKDIRAGKTDLNSIPCNFVSALYREGKEIRVLRLVTDYTAEQADGGRDWAWYFYTNYTDSDVPMRLEDLDKQDMINRYNKDKWVYLPWINIYNSKEMIRTNIGPRTKTENVAEGSWSRFFYKAGRTAEEGTIPANMYREPLLAFTVQRVFDKGERAKFFDGTNTEITEFAMVREMKPDIVGNDEAALTSTNAMTYMIAPDRFYLNDKSWQPAFGMTNSTPFMEE